MMFRYLLLILALALLGGCDKGGGSGDQCGGATCNASELCCNDACVDTQTSPIHCGDCTTKCGAHTSCVDGACAACPSGETECPSGCVDLQSNEANCSFCGNTCGNGSSCQSATCKPLVSCTAPNPDQCPGNDTSSAYCTNFSDNDANCGSCGHSCAFRIEECDNSSCVVAVSDWTTLAAMPTATHKTVWNSGIQLNGAYTYDSSFACTNNGKSLWPPVSTSYHDASVGGNCKKTSIPGSQKNAVLNYLAGLSRYGSVFYGQCGADKDKTCGFNQLYVYGTDLELYVPGGGSGFNWNADNSNDPNYNGSKNVAAYYSGDVRNLKVQLVGIVDGRTDALGVQIGLLSEWNNFAFNGSNTLSLNNLTQSQAQTLADCVSFGCETKKGGQMEGVCDAENIMGIQFDLEPFHVPAETGGKDGSGWGQYYFYKRIANNFTGLNRSEHKWCNRRFPLYYSLFLYASSMNDNVVDMLKNNSNEFVGYVVDSLYDLGGDAKINTERAGFVTSADSYYKKLVDQEVKDMRAKALKYGFYYQMAIPASSSAHEFGYTVNKAIPNDSRHGSLSDSSICPKFAHNDSVLENNSGICNPLQAIYVNTALQAMVDNSVASDQYFLGTVLWAFQEMNHWIPREKSEWKNTTTDTSDPRKVCFKPDPTNPYWSSIAHDPVCDAGWIGVDNKTVGLREYFPNSVNDPDNSAVGTQLTSFAKELFLTTKP